MTFPLDGPVPDEFIQEIDDIDLLEEIPSGPTDNEITPKVELFPEYAKQFDEAVKIKTVKLVGAVLDALRINGISDVTSKQIMNSAIELLKTRKICDLTKTI